jgi:glucose-6-phosphate isomerase
MWAAVIRYLPRLDCYPLLLPVSTSKCLVKGAKDMANATGADVPFERKLPANMLPFVMHFILQGKKIEIMVNYQPKLALYGRMVETALRRKRRQRRQRNFPCSVDFSSDLHSMGQYIQEGERILFETVLSVAKPDREVRIPEDKLNLDGLNFLAGKRVDYVNKMAELGTQIAHVDGNVPISASKLKNSTNTTSAR